MLVDHSPGLLPNHPETFRRTGGLPAALGIREVASAPPEHGPTGQLGKPHPKKQNLKNQNFLHCPSDRNKYNVSLYNHHLLDVVRL